MEGGAPAVGAAPPAEVKGKDVGVAGASPAGPAPAMDPGWERDVPNAKGAAPAQPGVLAEEAPNPGPRNTLASDAWLDETDIGVAWEAPAGPAPAALGPDTGVAPAAPVRLPRPARNGLQAIGEVWNKPCGVAPCCCGCCCCDVEAEKGGGKLAAAAWAWAPKVVEAVDAGVGTEMPAGWVPKGGTGVAAAGAGEGEKLGKGGRPVLAPAPAPGEGPVVVKALPGVTKAGAGEGVALAEGMGEGLAMRPLRRPPPLRPILPGVLAAARHEG